MKNQGIRIHLWHARGRSMRIAHDPQREYREIKQTSPTDPDMCKLWLAHRKKYGNWPGRRGPQA